MDLTKKIVQQFTYSKNILNLINDFITIPPYQINKNKKKCMAELDHFLKWAMEPIYDDMEPIYGFNKDMLEDYYDCYSVDSSSEEEYIPTPEEEAIEWEQYKEMCENGVPWDGWDD